MDATSSPASFVAMTAALQVGTCLLLGVVAAVLPTESRQTLGVVAVGMSAFFTVALGGSVFAQRGVTNPHSAIVGGWLALGFAAAVPAAGLAWWLLPAVVPPADERREPPSAAADDSPEVVPPWSAPVPAGSGGYVVAGLLALLAVGLATTAGALGGGARHPPRPRRGAGDDPGAAGDRERRHTGAASA